MSVSYIYNSKDILIWLACMLLYGYCLLAVLFSVSIMQKFYIIPFNVRCNATFRCYCIGNNTGTRSTRVAKRRSVLQELDCNEFVRYSRFIHCWLFFCCRVRHYPNNVSYNLLNLFIFLYATQIPCRLSYLLCSGMLLQSDGSHHDRCKFIERPPIAYSKRFLGHQIHDRYWHHHWRFIYTSRKLWHCLDVGRSARWTCVHSGSVGTVGWLCA